MPKLENWAAAGLFALSAALAVGTAWVLFDRLAPTEQTVAETEARPDDAEHRPDSESRAGRHFAPAREPAGETTPSATAGSHPVAAPGAPIPPTRTTNPIDERSVASQAPWPSGTSETEPPASAESRPSASENAGDDRELDEDGEISRLPIRGWVMTHAGEPVSGVIVTATGQRLWQRDGAIVGGTFDDTDTDAEGYFEFASLPEGEYELRVAATENTTAAWTTVRTGVESVVLRVGEAVNRTVRIHGFVTDSGGAPLQGVRVLPVSHRGSAESGADGAYRIGVVSDRNLDSLRIRFLLDGYRQGDVELRGADLSEMGTVRADVVMQAEGPTADVTGSVRGDDGRPVGGARIQLVSQQLRRSYQAISETSGAFTLSAVEAAEDYQLWVRAPSGFKDHVEYDLAVPRYGVHRDVVLEPVGTASLRGRMVDIYGRPIPRLTLYVQTSQPASRALISVRGDREGEFSIGGIPAGRLSLSTRSSPDLRVYGLDLPEGRRTEAELVLDWGRHELSGHILDPDDRAVAGAGIELAWDYEFDGVVSQSRRVTASDSRGYFLFGELGPGPHTVTVTAPGFRPRRIEVNPDVWRDGVAIRLSEES